MTKEQEKAIEWTRNLIKTIEESQKLFRKDIAVKSGITIHNNLQELLNLIKKQQEENEKLKKLLDERFIYVTGARTVYARLMSLDKEIIVKDDLKLRNEIKQDIAELEKKDKIIDEILKNYIELTMPTISKCQNLELKSYLLQQYNNGKFDNILNQTKQYFLKKVEDK